MPAQFKCSNIKCAYAIAAEGLNKIQLQVLRRWAKSCPKCGTYAKFIEQASMLKNENNQSNGGTPNAKTTQALPKTASQKRKAARHDGQH